MNEFEVIMVKDDLESKGYDQYQLRPGNDCVWASINQGNFWLDFYYIFRQGRIVDIQID